jgi:hypothetical protein
MLAGAPARLLAQAPTMTTTPLENAGNKLKVKVVVDPKDNALKQLKVFIVGKDGGSRTMQDAWATFDNNTVVSEEFSEVPKNDYTLIFVMRYVKPGASASSFSTSTGGPIKVAGPMTEDLGKLAILPLDLPGGGVNVTGAYAPPAKKKWKTKGKATLFFFPAAAVDSMHAVDVTAMESFSKEIPKVAAGTYTCFWRVEVQDDAGVSKGHITSSVVVPPVAKKLKL